MMENKTPACEGGRGCLWVHSNNVPLETSQSQAEQSSWVDLDLQAGKVAGEGGNGCSTQLRGLLFHSAALRSIGSEKLLNATVWQPQLPAENKGWAQLLITRKFTASLGCSRPVNLNCSNAATLQYSFPCCGDPPTIKSMATLYL